MGAFMRMKSVLAAALASALAIGFAGPALAVTLISFDYTGTASVGGVVSNLNSVSPTNNATRYFSPPFPQTGDIRDRASLVNFGTPSPFVFAAGAATQGIADAGGTLTVRVDITNDTGAATEFLWQGLIFSGGVGFAVPYFNEEDCDSLAIEACGSYLNVPFTVGSAEFAAMNFAATLAGVPLFSGAASVDQSGTGSSFNGITLNNFGAAANNPNFLEWDETTFSQSLGIFAAGETKTLEFIIGVSAVTLRSFCNSDAILNCVIAMAGFGDPPGGGSGGVSQDSGGAQRSLAFTFIGPSNQAPQVPLPPAALLFAAGLLGLGARRLGARKP